MKKSFQNIILCWCIIISNCLVGCSAKTTANAEGDSVLESMSSESEAELETDVESIGGTTESIDGELEEESNSEDDIVETEDRGSETSESEELRETEKPSEPEGELPKPSESEKPSENPNEEPSESESESQKPSKPNKTGKDEDTEEESSESESDISSDDIVCWVDSGVEQSKTLVSEKYGLKIYEVTNIYYDYFSDGSKVEKSRDTSTSIDHSGYNATDSELLPETLEVAKNNKSLYEEALKYANEYRDGYSYTVTSELANGLVSTTTYTCNPAVLDEELCKAATMRAMEMFYGDYYDHRRADGRGCSQFDCFNIASGSECISHCGFIVSPKDAIDDWYNSTSGHKEILLGAGMTKVGFGYFNGYWVMITG